MSGTFNMLRREAALTSSKCPKPTGAFDSPRYVSPPPNTLLVRGEFLCLPIAGSAESEDTHLYDILIYPFKATTFPISTLENSRDLQMTMESIFDPTTLLVFNGSPPPSRLAPDVTVF